MSDLLDRIRPVALNAWRIVLGFTFFTHGGQKLMGWFGRDAVAEILSLRGQVYHVVSLASLGVCVVVKLVPFDVEHGPNVLSLGRVSSIKFFYSVSPLVFFEAFFYFFII